MNPEVRTAPHPQPRSQFSHYLPRLKREFYQADAVVFWTLTVTHRQTGWLTHAFHSQFRELMLHCAARASLLCPAYCLMPDHLHLIWMGLSPTSDQRNAMAFLRTHLKRLLHPAVLQHQAYDHVLSDQERTQSALAVTCADYVLLNPPKAGLVDDPAEWSFSGAVIPGYYEVNPFKPGYWEWFWERHAEVREPGIEQGNSPLVKWNN